MNNDAMLLTVESQAACPAQACVHRCIGPVALGLWLQTTAWHRILKMEQARAQMAECFGLQSCTLASPFKLIILMLALLECRSVCSPRLRHRPCHRLEGHIGPAQ